LNCKTRIKDKYNPKKSCCDKNSLKMKSLPRKVNKKSEVKKNDTFPQNFSTKKMAAVNKN